VDARGAGIGGNGGFVEISGKERLAFDGKVDLAGPLGKAGQVLFDSLNINILAGIGAQDAELTDGQIFAADGGNADFEIGPTFLERINGDISLQASQNINLNTSLFFGNQPGRKITFLAGWDFKGAGQHINAYGQNISIAAFGAYIQIEDINTYVQSHSINAGKGGAVNLYAPGGVIAVGDIQTQSQACPHNGCGSLLPLHILRPNGISSDDGGNIWVEALGNIRIARISSFSESLEGNAGEGGDIELISRAGGIDALSINSASSADGDAGRGGGIGLSASKGINIEGSLDTQSNASAPNARSDSGGNVYLRSINGDIQIEEIKSGSLAVSKAGRGGSIAINADGNITTKDLNSQSQTTINGTASNGGNITLTSEGGNIKVSGQVQSFSLSQDIASYGGDVIFEARQGTISTGPIYTFSKPLSTDQSVNKAGRIILIDQWSNDRYGIPPSARDVIRYATKKLPEKPVICNWKWLKLYLIRCL
jgi:hypothetical protein